MNLVSNVVQTPSPTRRRVLFVDHAAVMGGAELSLLDLAIAYRDTSRVLLFDQGPFRERLEGANVPVQVIAAPASLLSVKASGGLSALKAIPGLGWMARRIVEQSRDVDLIHANSQKAFVAAALARWMGAPPVVWHLRDILTAGHFSAMNRRLAIALANAQASQVMVNSQATGEAFVAAGGRPNLVHLVYNGLSAQAFDAVSEEQAIALRHELGLGADVPIIGSFSRLSYWKGQHVLLEAVRSLPEVQVLLVGKSLFGEDDYVAQLQDLAASPELAGRVHWIGFRTDIPVLMKACSIVAHTSTEPEPFGRVIVEGQLAQRPVIATAAGGAVELVEDGVTGRLVPPKDAIALRQAIQEILDHPQQTADLAQRGYEHAKSTFSLESLLTNFDQALSLI